MIEIVRKEGEIDGTSTYTITVGNHYICNFKHNRQDGLANCLQEAADAVELSEWADFVIMDDCKGG